MTCREKEIVQAMADNWLSQTKAGREIFLSYRTVDYHVSAIRKRTGLDPRDFWDMIRLVQMHGITREGVCTERNGELTPLGYMERQLMLCRSNLELQQKRGAPEKDIQNIVRKIGYYEAAASALRLCGD